MKMAVLSVTGSYLPRGLTFGPVNGPEDFQGLVFEVFARRLYKDHFICIDDLAVATGRKACRPPGPSQVADVVNAFSDERRENGDGERNGGDVPVSGESPSLKAPGAPAGKLGAGGNFYMNDEEMPHLEDSESESGECVGLLYEDSLDGDTDSELFDDDDTERQEPLLSGAAPVSEVTPQDPCLEPEGG